MEQLKTLLRDKYVQSVLLFVLIVGGYIAYKNAIYYFGAPVVEETKESQTTTRPGGSTDAMEVMDQMGAGDDPTEEDPYKGIHIMPNGDVMLGNGDVLPDASVSDDGMILLGDGTTIEPVMDLRK